MSWLFPLKFFLDEIQLVHPLLHELAGKHGLFLAELFPHLFEQPVYLLRNSDADLGGLHNARSSNLANLAAVH